MFSDDSWDRRDAQVVCTMLGFSPRGARATLDSAFGQVEANFIMDEVNCTGEESSLEQCPHNTVHDCGSYEGAGVICAPQDLNVLWIYTEIISKLLTLWRLQVVIARKKSRLFSCLTQVHLKPLSVSTGHLGQSIDSPVGL